MRSASVRSHAEEGQRKLGQRKLNEVVIKRSQNKLPITEIKEILVYRAPNADLMDVCRAPWATGP